MKTLRLFLAGAFASVAAFLCPLSAQAVPVTWNLQDTHFSDGTTATGQFVYDADTNAYSSWNISLLNADNYAFWIFVEPTASLYSGSARTLVLSTPNYEYLINLIYEHPLTNAGGTASLQGAYAGLFGVYTITSGTLVSAEAVPEPATLWVAGLGLMGLGLARRQRARSISDRSTG